MSDNGAGRDLLDRALRDLTAEQRARALDLVLRLGIDRDDPLFLVTLAIGQLQTILEDYPQELRDTFESLSADLTTWKDTNLGVLEAIGRQADAGEQIASVSKELVNSLSVLTRLLSAQLQQPQSYPRELENFRNKLDDMQTGLDYRLTSITESLESQKSVRNMSNTSTGQHANAIGRWSVNWLLVLLLVGSSSSWWVLWQGQQQNTQTLQWLLQKSTRLECFAGAVNKKAAQCRQFR